MESTRILIGGHSFVANLKAYIGRNLSADVNFTLCLPALGDKLVKRDCQIEATDRRLGEQTRLQGGEDRPAETHCETPCKCKDIFDNFVTCGNTVFSGQLLLFVTDPSDTAPTNSAASVTVWPFSTFSTSVMVSVSFDSNTSTPLTANLLGDYNPRVTVEPMPSFSNIFGSQRTRPVIETLELPC